MKILHSLILLALTGSAYSSTQRIVGGMLAEPHSIPFQVALFPVKVVFTVPLICGGSLVSKTAVLTAAHCLKDTVRTRITIGGYNLTAEEDGIYNTTVESKSYRIHPDFNHRYAYHDIALIILDKTVDFSHQIQKVALPTVAESFADEIGTISGYGNTCDGCRPSLILKIAQNKILTNEACSAILGTIAIPSSTQICASTAETKSGICRGDSGKSEI